MPAPFLGPHKLGATALLDSILACHVACFKISYGLLRWIYCTEGVVIKWNVGKCDEMVRVIYKREKKKDLEKSGNIAREKFSTKERLLKTKD